MNTATKILSVALWGAIAGPVGAQSPDATASASAPKPSKQTAQSEAGEPRAALPDSAANAPAAAPATGSSPPSQRAASVPKAGSRPVTRIDRLDLGTATVTGEREQPKVMYIVPWKRSDIGDLAGKPMNSLVDEILAPVDRDVFKREVVYYHAVQADASQNGAPRDPSPQGEK